MEEYSQTELLNAFNKVVAKQEHWKDPICSIVAGGVHLEKVIAAIRHFTATEPVCKPSQVPGSFIVLSEGYRLGPAGDH